MLPLTIPTIENHVLVANSSKNESILCHLWYKNLNVQVIKLLSRKEIVSGLLKIEFIKVCECCIYRKQSRKLFPIRKFLRAKCFLNSVHADLC